MPVISNRPAGFIVGVAILFVCSLVFLVGFATPFWLVFDFGIWHFSFSDHQGLWTACYIDDCDTIQSDHLPTWFHVCRALECVCLLLLFAACVSCIIVNFCRSEPGPPSRVPEITATLGGLAGFIGAMVYVGEMDDVVDSSYPDSTYNFSWSLYLSVISSLGSVVAAVLIAVFNRNLDDPSHSRAIFLNVSSQPQQGRLLSPTPTYAAIPSQQVNVQGNYPPPPAYVQGVPSAPTANTGNAYQQL